MTATLQRRRQLRLNAEHDDALVVIAAQRGCDVSDLFREAVIAHFNLPVDVSQTNSMLDSDDADSDDD